MGGEIVEFLVGEETSPPDEFDLGVPEQFVEVGVRFESRERSDATGEALVGGGDDPGLGDVGSAPAEEADQEGATGRVGARADQLEAAEGGEIDHDVVAVTFPDADRRGGLVRCWGSCGGVTIGGRAVAEDPAGGGSGGGVVVGDASLGCPGTAQAPTAASGDGQGGGDPTGHGDADHGSGADLDDARG
jgi:hypothetical protein